jgi:hypothetical protein
MSCIQFVGKLIYAPKYYQIYFISEHFIVKQLDSLGEVIDFKLMSHVNLFQWLWHT